MDRLLQRVRGVFNQFRGAPGRPALRISTFAVCAFGTVHAGAAAPPPFPAPSEAARKACAKPGRTTAEVQVCLTPQVWAKSIVGAVQLGLDAQNRPTGRVFYAMVLGPGKESITPAKNRGEIEKSLQHLLVNKTAAVLVRELDKAPSVASQLAKAAEANPAIAFGTKIKEIEAEGLERAWSAMQAATINYRSSTQKLYSDFKLNPAEFRFAVYEADCRPPSCTIPGWARVRDDVGRIDRFSKLEVWQRLGGIPKEQLTGFRQQNVASGLEHGPLAEVRGLPAGTVTAQRRGDEFERLVRLLRSDPKKFSKGFEIDAVAPKLVDLSQRSALAIIDVLQSPATAMHQLPAAGKVLLGRVSDELARTRILECTRLRGNTTPASIGECAGYTLDAATLAACATNKQCFPPIGAKVVIDAVMIADLANLRSLADAAALPRIKLAASMDELKARVDLCTAEATPSARAMCLAKKAVPAGTGATLDCSYKASSLKGKAHTAALEKCVLDSLPPDQRQAVGCVQNFSAQKVDALLCLSEDKMSPEAKALAECVQETPAKDRTRKSLGLCFLDKQVPGSVEMLNCLQRPAADWRDTVSCALAKEVGGDVGRALECAKKNNASTAGTAVCMVKIEGDLGKAAACLAQTNADPLGTLICTAGDSGMTVDQRIAVQCAAQTGGEPASFTTCVVGQMTMKELSYCKGKKFGEGNCFNKNNEFRKIFSQAGIEIGPNSVVADIVNVHLKYLEAQIAYVSGAIEVAKDVADAAEKKLKDAANLMEAATRSVIQIQVDAVKAVENAGKGLCTGVAKAVFGKSKRC